MKQLTFIIIISLSLLTYSQKSDTLSRNYENKRGFKQGWVSNNGALSLEGGIASYQIKELNNFLKSQTGTPLNDFIFNYGVSFSNTRPLWINKNYLMDSHYDFSFYASLNPSFSELNDSIRYFIQGFNIGFDNCKDLLPEQRNIDFLFGAGYNVGLISFTNWNINQGNIDDFKKVYRNLYFSPKIVSELRFVLFKHFSLSLRSEIQLDVTNGRWLSNDKNLEGLGRFKTTGFNLRLTMGYIGKN